MKKLLTIIAVLITTAILVIGTSLRSNSTGSGAPTGTANDPSGGFVNCTDCHSGTATATTTVATITTNIPASGYVPGTTYTVTATATYAGKTKFGFEVSPQNSAGTKLGTLINTGTATKLVGTSKYVTHTSAGTTGTTGSHTWSFNWTAPAAGSGPVTFYGSFLVTNANGSTSGDLTYTTNTTVTEAVPCTIAVSISGLDTICPQDTISLVANSTPAAASYVWSNGQSLTNMLWAPAGTYTVTVTAPGGCTASATKTVIARTLNAPTNVALSNIKGTSATLAWAKASCATGYTLQYRPVGTTVWKTVQLADTAKKNLFALLPSTTYELHILSKVGTALSAYGPTTNFTTLCSCLATTPTLSSTSATNQIFTWVDDSCGVRYKLQYKKSSVTAWTTKIVGDTVNSITITTLALGTSYDYQFRRECSTAITYTSAWSIGTFTTPLAVGITGLEDYNPASTIARIIKITDPAGRHVEYTTPGLKFVYYSDGTVRKIFTE